MKTTIYYYTGSGNSLWTARQLAQELGDCELVPMAMAKQAPEGGAVGFVFPVHIWGVPPAVLSFIKNLKFQPQAYYFAAAVNAGQVSRTLIQLKEELKKLGVELNAGFDVVLASNYIPWGGPGTDEEIKGLMEKAVPVIKEAAQYVKEGKKGRLDMGPLWQRVVFTWMYNSSAKYINYMDKNFFADEKCNGCAICEKICPAANITMKEGKPVWNKKCQQCFACLQWCPKEAIQYGKKTHQYRRYQNPQVKLADMLDVTKG